jgi:hypothetical protein
MVQDSALHVLTQVSDATASTGRGPPFWTV